MHDKSGSAQYEQLQFKRQSYLKRARACANVTIPTLMPPEGANHTTEYATPYQSVGSRGVNNLASKLLLALLPPNSPFFKLQIDDFTLRQLTGGQSDRADVEEAFARMERAVMTEVEGIGLRSPVFEVLKQLIVAGNVLLFIPKEGKPQMYRLDQYVVKRDSVGNLLMAIMKESVAKEALSQEVREILPDESGDYSESSGTKDDDTVCVYTKYWLEDGKYHMYQEVEGQKIPGSEGEWDKDKGPVLALRWTAMDGEDYGRSYVEEYLGDLISLEGLMESIIDASAAMARLLIFVSPNGTTRLKDVAEAENGAVLQGDGDEVDAFTSEKYADLSVPMQTASDIIERLKEAFLMNSAVQRNAERVTAAEVRYVAGELEDSLGGVFTILSQEFQLPLVNRLMSRMVKQNRLPSLPEGVVRPTIVTGLEALGRGHDLNKYQLFLQTLSTAMPPEQIAERINADDFITRVGTAVGIDMNGLVKTPEQIAQERAEALQQQAAQLANQTAADAASKSAPEAVKAMAQQVQGE